MKSGKVSSKEIETKLIETAFKENKKKLYNLIKKYTHNNEIANDILQETFLIFTQFATKLDLLKEPKYYLYVIAINKVKKWHSKIIKENNINLHKKYLLHLNEKKLNFIEDIENTDLSKKLKFEIAHLSDKEKRVVNLHIFDHLTFNQIAEEMKISLSTAKRCMNSAKRNLKTKLNEIFNEYD